MEACKVLLDNQVDKNPTTNNGCTPLHYAAMNGQLDACKTLIDYGVEKNQKNVFMFGWTPLDLAARECHLGVVCFLRGELSS